MNEPHPGTAAANNRHEQITTPGNAAGRRELSRHEVPPAPGVGPSRANTPSASKVTTPSNPNQNAPGEARGRNAPIRETQPAQENARAQALAQERARIYAGGHNKPILHNPVFASTATRDPAMRTLARSNFQGRFAESWRDRNDHDRFADRRGFRRGIVIGWGGPVFWPYAYTDFVDYVFWPYGEDTFWPYAYDDVYDGIFGAYAPDATAYADVPAVVRRAVPRGLATGVAATGTAQVCSGEASGLTDFPIERIADQVGPTDTQRSLLDNLRDTTLKAVDLLKSNCPTDIPTTPTGRLAAMRQRTEIMLQAVQTVRPALDQFYQSLSDEQKERFIALEGEGTPRGSARAAPQPDLTQTCGGSTKQITGLPINQIQQLLHPDDTQRAALDELSAATRQAADQLSHDCAPTDQPLTPTGRVAAMEMRLDAMLKALDTVQPAMATFYNSLSDEQKARLDRLGPRQG